MKKLILIVLTFTSLSSFAGVHLICDQSAIDQGGHLDHMNGVKNISILSCEGKNRERYTMFIKGYGLGGKIALFSEFAVTCPTVNKRKLHKRGKVTLGTIKANASVFIGANAAVAANHKGGFCVMAGYDFYGFAASVSVGKMVIYKGSLYEQEGLVYEELKQYLPTWEY